MICIHCQKTDPEDFYYTEDRNRGVCKSCLKKHRTYKKWFAKKKAVEYLGGKCIRCGYDKSLSALDFHHRNSSQKEKNVSMLLSSFAKWSTIAEELNKCDLLCANCHREAHHTEVEVSIDFSKVFSEERVRRGDRLKSVVICPECGLNPVARKRKFCSSECFRSASSKPRPHLSNCPEKEELVKVSKGKTRKEVADYYNVSEATIRKWMKSLGCFVSKASRLEDALCKQCGKKFHPESKEQKYCSRDCLHKKLGRVSRPPMHELELLSKTMTHRELAGKYGVHHSTIQKWLINGA